jgi:nicotinate-nucleotide adenylyltransferase
MSDIEFILGGSFDPIHFGHLHIIDSLQDLNSSWPVRILPCSVPALKKRTSASFVQRVEMIQLALKDYNNVIVDRRESHRTGKSYSYDTLRELAQEYPGRRFVLVIGSDNLETIGQWYQAEQLAKCCHLVVVDRPDTSVEQQQAHLIDLGFRAVTSHLELAEVKSGLFYHYKIIERDTSSTAIRDSFRGSRIESDAGDVGSQNDSCTQNETRNQNSLTVSNAGSENCANGLAKHSQNIALTSLDNKTASQIIDALNIDTPVAVKDYIINHSIYT